MESSFCKRLPKLELHAHLNGSLTRETLLELFEYHEKTGYNKIKNVDRCFIKDSYSLSEFFNIFKIIYILTASPVAIQIATERVIEDFCNDNVVYLELRSTLRNENGMTKHEYIESMVQGVLSCRRKFPIISVKLIISINRSESLESAKENILTAIEYSKKYPDIIVGIDTSGNPERGRFNDYVHLLSSARKEGLKVTVHCGEIVDNEEVKDILKFQPDRIGHGTCIHELFGGNQDNWDDLIQKKLPVELCLTSNVKCKTVDSYEKHHFKVLFDAGHPISLATDDKGIFCCSLSGEYEILGKVFNLKGEELWQLSYNSIDQIFGNENEKEALKILLSQWKSGNL